MKHLMRLVAPLMWKVTGKPSCQEINGFLAEYVDGTLDPEVSKQYHTHLGKCGTCGSYLEQYEETIRLARECRDSELPEDLVEHTLAFLRERRGA